MQVLCSSAGQSRASRDGRKGRTRDSQRVKVLRIHFLHLLLQFLEVGFVVVRLGGRGGECRDEVLELLRLANEVADELLLVV